MASVTLSGEGGLCPSAPPASSQTQIPVSKVVGFTLSGESAFAGFKSIPSSAATTALSSERQPKPQAGTVNLSGTLRKVSVTF